jgi:hypothetical protein
MERNNSNLIYFLFNSDLHTKINFNEKPKKSLDFCRSERQILVFTAFFFGQGHQIQPLNSSRIWSKYELFFFVCFVGRAFSCSLQGLSPFPPFLRLTRPTHTTHPQLTRPTHPTHPTHPPNSPNPPNLTGVRKRVTLGSPWEGHLQVRRKERRKVSSRVRRAGEERGRGEDVRGCPRGWTSGEGKEGEEEGE